MVVPHSFQDKVQNLLDDYTNLSFSATVWELSQEHSELLYRTLKVLHFLPLFLCMYCFLRSKQTVHCLHISPD